MHIWKALDIENHRLVRRFAQFMNSRPLYSKFIMPMREIDGSLIEIGSWPLLLSYHPALRIELALERVEAATDFKEMAAMLYLTASDKFPLDLA